MDFIQMRAGQAIRKLIREDKLIVSVFLPFGIAGQDEKRCIIERRKTLSQLAAKLEIHDSFWRQGVDVIRKRIEDFQPSHPPCSKAFFYNREVAIEVDLGQQVRPHFAFAPYAEIEPLIYMNWAHESYVVLELDPDEPKLLRGHGPELIQTHLDIPEHLQQTVGELATQFSFEKVIETADRNANPGTSLEGHAGQQLHGLSSRRSSHKQKNRDYWFRILRPLFKHNLKPEDRYIFLAGVEDLLIEFTADGHEFKIPKENFILSDHYKGYQQLAECVMKRLIDRKIRQANEDMERLDLTKNDYDILDTIRTGQTRDLYIQQLDWFTDSNRSERSYEHSNPRSAIISRALRFDAKIHYTSKDIPNRHHIGLRAV